MRRVWLGLGVAAVLGCGRVRFDARVPDGDLGTSDGDGATSSACSTFGPWGAPSRLDALDLGGNEAGGQISPDGLTLWFDTDATGGGDVYVAHRVDRQSGFDPPQLVSAIDTPGAQELDASVTEDELELYFSRLGVASCIYRSTRASTADAWGAPMAIDPLCVGGPVGGPYVTPDGLVLYYNDIVSTNYEGTLMVTTRTDRLQAFGSGTPVPGQFGATPSGYPALSGDRLSIYFERGMPLEVYVATRPDVDSPFGVPQTIPAIEDPIVDDQDPSITADGLELYFSSDRAGTADLYVSTRTCVSP
jgi:WD40-like Beta Propeller Repeat